LALIALTADGKKVVSISGSASGSVDAGASATISVPIGMDILAKKLAVLGLANLAISGATVYIVSISVGLDSVDVTVYNPGTAAVTVTVSATVTVLGV